MKKVKSFISSNVQQGILALCFGFDFFIFFYKPLEIYLTNTTEFWFDLKHLFPVILTCFLSALIIFIGILEILKRFLSKYHKVFSAIYTLFLAVFIGLYIQGTYIPRNYGVLDGTTIDWSLFHGYAIASVILWISVICIIIIGYLKLYDYLYKIATWLSLTIFIMLMAALISLFPKMEKSDNNTEVVMTNKDEFVLSNNKNIVILILDAFDANNLRELLAEDADKYSDILTDFTFYTNTIGGYPSTKAALPFILTQQWYENDMPYDEYIATAWKGTDLYRNLVGNNYSIGIYTSERYLDKSANFA